MRVHVYALIIDLFLYSVNVIWPLGSKSDSSELSWHACAH